MSRIKGITISIDGETRGLDKALQDVNKRSRDLQSELRQVDRLLKFNPQNTELLAQRQKLLADQVENTRERLTRLKNAQAEVQAQFERGEIGAEQYRAFQREIIETESKLKHFESQLESSRTKLEKYGEAMQKAGGRLKDVGDRTTEIGKDLSMKVTTPLLGVGTAAVMVGAEFEQSMSKVSALSGATGDDLERLEGQARELGKTTVFSATQAAEAQAFLAMAGYEVNEILDSMPGLLNLAAAGQMDLGRAADITTNIMSAFGIEADRTAHVADVLAKASASANTDVSQLGEAIKYLGPVANSLGWSLEESTAAVMSLSNAGIQGSMAGQAFASSLARLAKPTREMENLMRDLNISFFDADGVMRPLPDVIAELERGLQGMTAEQKSAALSTLFGAEAYKHWAVLLDEGSETLSENTQMLIEADGAAKQMADTMSDNFIGALNQMKSALSESAIIIFKNIQPALESLVERVKSAAEWFNNLSPRMQNMIILAGGFAAAIGPLLVILGTLAASLGSIINIMGKLLPLFSGSKSAIGVFRTGIAALSGPIGIAIAAIAAFIAIGVALYKNWDDVKKYLENTWNGIKNVSTNIWNAIKNFFSSTWDTISRTVSNVLNQIRNSISNNFNNMLNSVRNVLTNLRNTITNIWNNVLSFLRGINLYSIGADIMRGFLNGITSLAGQIRDRARSIADSVKNTIKSALRIASPSKVMKQLGEWTVEGLDDGLRSMMSDIRKTANELANATIPNISTSQFDDFMNNSSPIANPAQLSQTIEIPIYLDGREIARGTAQFMNRELQNIQNIRGRSIGLV